MVPKLPPTTKRPPGRPPTDSSKISTGIPPETWKIIDDTTGYLEEQTDRQTRIDISRGSIKGEKIG